MVVSNGNRALFLLLSTNTITYFYVRYSDIYHLAKKNGLPWGSPSRSGKPGKV